MLLKQFNDEIMVLDGHGADAELQEQSCRFAFIAHVYINDIQIEHILVKLYI